MRVSREQAEKNRKAVVETAASLFRERGIDGVGVAELMKTAGLTHGGFYGQFDSKDDLVLEAAAQAVQENEDNWDRLIDSADAPWEAVKRSYLSNLHRRHPESGCAFAALAVEAPRRGAPLQSVLTRGMKALLGKLEAIMPRRRGKAPKDQAMIALSAMVGAVVLARAIDDEAMAKELLDAVREGI